MTTIPEHVEAYWEAFLESPAGLDSSDDQFYESFRIGTDVDDANEGAELILSGEKTATSSLLWEHERSGNSLPTVGSLSVLEDGDGKPVCVVRTTWVKVIPFRDVDAQFAYDYAEGDRSLEGWRRTFWTYYCRLCAEIEHEMSEEALLVCERFEVVYA